MTTNPDLRIEAAVKAFRSNQYEFEIFKDGVKDFFLKNPSLSDVVHTVKTRLKDIDHLREKIGRKSANGRAIDAQNLFDEVTDLAGVRVLHLYQDQFPAIHSSILARVNAGDWKLKEKPIAYTWDPESQSFFEGLGLHVERKESFYTSIHYVVKPRSDSPISCEIQVRTLFEEIWGEIDHKLNYPKKCDVDACREQILVLSKLVGAGSRLADSIFRAEAHMRTTSGTKIKAKASPSAPKKKVAKKRSR